MEECEEKDPCDDDIPDDGDSDDGNPDDGYPDDTSSPSDSSTNANNLPCLVDGICGTLADAETSQADELMH